jgi:hypothetical protein
VFVQLVVAAEALGALDKEDTVTVATTNPETVKASNAPLESISAAKRPTNFFMVRYYISNQ